MRNIYGIELGRVSEWIINIYNKKEKKRNRKLKDKGRIKKYWEGSNHLIKLLKAVIFGDYLSVYCALLNSEDPSTIEMIQKLKSI